jgi:hypothetical protein
MAVDISALMSSLWYWELAGYATLVAVAIGVAGESVHELTEWFKKSPWWKAKGGIASALLLIAALAAEVVTQIKTSGISGQTIAFLSDQAAETRERAAGLEKQAADISERAAKAETEAANLMKENVELEREIAPRLIEQGGLLRAVSALPRVPIFVTSLDQEEPKQVAGYLLGLRGIKLGDAPMWSVTLLPPENNWYPEGITVQYIDPWRNSTDDSSEKVAEAICENIKSQEIKVNTRSVPPGWERIGQWPPSAPDNAVVIRIGPKPIHFWENKLLRKKGMSDIPEYSFCTSEEVFEQGRQERLNRQRHPPQ